MGLAYIDRYSRFTRIRTIYDLLTKSVNSVFAENFIDYLSNSETTWGSPKTVILLEVSEFKKHLKKFVKTSEHCIINQTDTKGIAVTNAEKREKIMTQMPKSNFEVVSSDSLFEEIENISGVSSSQVEDYINDRMNNDLEASGQGWEYGLVYLKTINETVKEDVKNYEEGEDDDAVLISDALNRILETNDPETLVSFQGW